MHGLGSGPVRATRIGEGGGSNFTFLLERDENRFVLRRPPRPPLPPSAHDMVREARLQLALREAGFERLPTIVAIGEDESVLGVPFYVMEWLDGFVVTDTLPDGAEPRRLGNDLVDVLVEIHAADVTTPALAAFARPGSYNERQARRFVQLWEINKTREVPDVETLGTSPVTQTEGFPSRAELVARYIERSGRDVEPLHWFEALALWKAAVFCEAIYGRFVRGELAAEDSRAARFELGVPWLAQAALAAIEHA